MITDPRAILHVMLVEYRWLWLLYFTFFQVIRNTAIEITNGSESEDYTGLILCTGLSKFNVIMAEVEAQRLLYGEDTFVLEVDSCDDGPCSSKDCSNPYRGTGSTRSCSCSETLEDRDMGPFYLNMTMMVGILGPYALLVIYCIAFKSGGFNGSMAGQKYIESCQSVQNSAVFRTYCNFLGFLSLGALVYGIYEAQFGGPDGEREANAQATQNLIVAGLAIFGLIRAPHRYGSAAGDYDLKILQEHRSGLLTTLTRLLFWDSTRYYEEYMRADKYQRHQHTETVSKNRVRPVDAGDDAKSAGDDPNTVMVKKNTGYCECFHCCD